jgi:hypothetical protein
MIRSWARRARARRALASYRRSICGEIQPSARAGALDARQILVTENRAGLFRDVRRLQPGHRVGDLFLASLALSGQVQAERIHLRLERPCVELLGHWRVPWRDGDSFTLARRIRHENHVRKVPFTRVGKRNRMRFERHENPCLPAVCAGERAD